MPYQPLGTFGPTCDPAVQEDVVYGPPGSIGNPATPQYEQIGIPLSFVVDNPEPYSPLPTGNAGDPGYFGPLCDPLVVQAPTGATLTDPATQFVRWPPYHREDPPWPKDIPLIPTFDGNWCKWDPVNKEYYDCVGRNVDQYGDPIDDTDPNCVGDDCYKFVDRLKTTYQKIFLDKPYTGPEFDEFYCQGYWPDEEIDPSIFELTTQTTNLQIGLAVNESFEHLLCSTTLYRTWQAGRYTGSEYNQWARDNFVHTTNYDARPNTSETFYVLHPVSLSKVGTHTVYFGADNSATMTWSGREGEDIAVFTNAGNFTSPPQTASITFTEPGWKRFKFTVFNGSGSSAWNKNPAGVGCTIPTLDGFNMATFAMYYPGGTGRLGKDVNSKILWSGTQRTGELELEVNHNNLFADQGTGDAPRAIGTVYKRFLVENDSIAITVGSRLATINIDSFEGENYDQGDAVVWIQNVEVLKSPPVSFHGFGSYILELPTGQVYDGTVNYTQYEALTPTPGTWTSEWIAQGILKASTMPTTGYLKSYGSIMCNIFDSTINTVAQNYVFQTKTRPYSYAVTHPLWSEFANDHMCWVNPAVCTLPAELQQIYYTIQFPESQEYVWEVCGDDDVKFILDGIPIGPASVGFATQGDTVFTQYVTSGPRELLVQCTNTKWNDSTAYQWASNPGGWGFKISSTGTNISSIDAVTFDSNGNLVSTGSGSAKVSLTLQWNDNPNTAGTALDNVQIGSTTWTQTAGVQTGTEGHTITISGAGTTNATYTGLTGGFTVEDNGTRLCLKDNDGSDCNANFTVDGITPIASTGTGIPEAFQLLNMSGEWEDVGFEDPVQREDDGSGWANLDQTIEGDYGMTGGNGSNLELNMTFQPIAGGNDTYDSLVAINSIKVAGTGYEVGDILNVAGLSPGYSSVVKVAKVGVNLSNAAGEIFNSRMGVGQALYKEGEESTINTGLAETKPLYGTTGFLEVVHAPGGYAGSGCATYTDGTNSTGQVDVIVPDINECIIKHVGGNSSGCGKFRIRVIIDGTEIINSARDNWEVADPTLGAVIDPKTSIQVVMDQGTEANADSDVFTKFEVVSTTTGQRALLITCRFEPTV